MPLQTSRFADISTGHLTAHDDAILRGHAEHHNGLLVYAYPGGYFIVVISDDRDEQIRIIRESGLSTAFESIYRAAIDQDIRLLRFDRDGDHQPDYPTCAW